MLTVHRTTVLADVISQLAQNKEVLNDPAVELAFTVINSRGKIEVGAGVGVCRDVIAMFWKRFLDSLTVGTKVRIPTIRHGYEAKEWDAIALFLLKGFTQCGYFPLALSRVYVKLVLSGEEFITDEELLNELLRFVAKDESDVISECLSGNLECDSEEILDVLSAYDVRQVPNVNNVRQVFTKLAHKEIVQRPNYITERWSVILQPARGRLLKDLDSLYEKLEPTTKKVVKLLKREPANDAERLVFGYLKKFVKGLESSLLKCFLTFTTGSDLMVCDYLTVNFTKVDGLSRRPIAHTCGPCLELPISYQSFPELREEFSAILALSTWEMDIV
jgi:hypothetical protein